MTLNLQNLRPVKTKDEARERGAAGGIASGKARRLKRAMRDWLRDDLSAIVGTDAAGNELTLAAYLARKHLNNVKKEVESGSTKEFVALVELVDGKNVNVGGGDNPVKIEQTADLSGVSTENLWKIHALLAGNSKKDESERN